MELEKKNNSQNQLEVEIEVEEGVIKKVKIPSSEGNYLMLTDVPKELLKHGEKGRVPYIVYIYLISCRNRITNQCFPSISTICNNVNMSKTTVKSAITYLFDNGFITINSGHSGLANNYYFPKEWFYKYFKDDIKQANANRVIRSEDKKTIEQLKKEKEKNKKRIENINKELDKRNKQEEDNKNKKLSTKEKMANITSKRLKATSNQNDRIKQDEEIIICTNHKDLNYIDKLENSYNPPPFDDDENPFI